MKNDNTSNNEDFEKLEGESEDPTPTPSPSPSATVTPDAQPEPEPEAEPGAITMSLPDEIVVDEDNPNASGYIYVSGRCYQKTDTKGEDYEVTHDQVFGGMLDNKSVTIASPKDSPKDPTQNRTDVMQVKFTDCNDCGSYGSRYRGQKKETGKDFKIKVIKEIDSDSSNAIRYKLNGEDRTGFFNLATNRDLLFYDNDSVTFDIESLNDEKTKFKVDVPGGDQSTTSNGNKLVLGQTRSDPGLYSKTRVTTSSITAGTYEYSEDGNVVMGGNLQVQVNPYEINTQYDEAKLKQFPDRLLAVRSHSLLIKNDGRVYGTGYNSSYSLGIDRSRPSSTRRTNITNWTPTLINEIGPIKKISGRGEHHCYITYDNKLYLSGKNDRGQLGRGSTTDSPTPQMAQINHASAGQEGAPTMYLSEDIHTRIIDADAGMYHTVALDVNQRVWVWGTSGLHGSHMISHNNVNTGKGGAYVHAGNQGSRYQESPYNTHDNSTIANSWQNGGHAHHFPRALLAFWGSTSATNSNSAYIKAADHFNTKETDEHIRQVACGLYTTFFLNNDGQVYSCGYNANGELGQGNVDTTENWDVGYSTQPHKSFASVLMTGGRKAGNTDNIWVKKVICGDRHTLLLTYDDELYGFGKNTDGCLGRDPSTDPFVSSPIKISAEGEKVYAVSAGSNASAYITYQGQVKVSGSNVNGKLGIDRYIEAPVPSIRTTTEIITSFTESPNLTGVIEIQLGHQFTLGLMTDGQVIALGDNQYGSLGTRGGLSTVNNSYLSYQRHEDVDSGVNSNNLLNFGRDINFKNLDKTLICMPNTTMIWEKEEADQSVKVAGRSHAYQGGFYSSVATAVAAQSSITPVDQTFEGTVTKSGAKITKIVAAHSDTVKMLNDKGELWSYGLGDRYQHGNGSASNIAIPVQPIHNDATLENIVNVAGGYYHTLALDDDNRLWGWGVGNLAGALVKSFNNVNTGKGGAYVHAGNQGSRYQESPYNTHDNSTIANSWQNGGHAKTTSPVLLNDGSGRVIPDFVGRIVDIQCSAYCTYILNEDGELFSCGYNANGELGQRHLNHYWDVGVSADQLHKSFGQVYPYTSVLDARIKKVIPGGRHCLVIMEDNKLYGWGANNNYQLGLSEGNTEGRIFKDKHHTPVFIADDVEDAFAGLNNSAYKKLDGSVYVMGANIDGQIAGWGDGRTLGLDRYDDIFGLKEETNHAKMPIPWFEPSDGVLEIAFGPHHSVVKRIRTQKNIDWYSAGSNQFGQRGTGRDPGGENGKWTENDHQVVDSQGNVTYPGSDKWKKIQTLFLG